MFSHCRRSLLTWKRIANPDLPAEDKAILDMQLKEVRQQIEQANSPERQALASFKTDLEDSFAGVRSAFSSAQDASFARSSTLSELKHLESTLTTLVASTGISESGKAQLQEQLDATKSAIAQLSAGKNIEFETPQQAEALQKALQGLQSLKPAPETGGVCAVPELPTGLPDASLSFGDFPGVTANIAGSNPTFDLMSPAPSLNLGMPDYSLELANYNLGSPTLPNMTLGTPSASSSSDPFNLNLNLDLGLAYNSYSLSNSFGFDLGMGSGLSGTGSLTGYGFGGPCVNPPASNSATPAQPSLSDALLKNIGEDPTKVTGPELSPEIKEQQAKTKEIIQSILNDPQAPPEAKQNAYMAQQIIDKPNAQTIQIGGQTHPLPPGTFQTTVDVMNAYQALIDKGVPSQDAVAIMDIAKEAITQNQSPEAIQAALQDIVGSPDAKSALKTLRDSQIQKRVENTAADETSYQAVAGMDITRSVAGRLGLGSGAAAVDIYKADDTAFRRAIQPEADALATAKAAFLADVKKIAGAQAANINSFEDARNFVSQSRNSSAVSLAGKLDQITSQEASLNRLVESRRNFVDVSRGMQTSIDAFKEANMPEKAATLAAIQASYLENGFLPADQVNTLATFINESRVFAFAAGVGRNQETGEQQDHWGGRVKELVDVQTDQTIPDNVRDQRQGAWLQGVIGDLRQGQLGMFTDRTQMNQILEIFKLPPLGPNETGEDFLARLETYSPAETRSELQNQEALAEGNVAVTTYHMTGEAPPGMPIEAGASPADVENAIFNYTVDASKAAAVDNAANVTPRDRLNSPDPNVRAAAEGLMRVQTENAQVATDILEMPADQRAAAWGAVAERENTAANILNDLTDVREASSNRLLEANNQWLAAGGFPPLDLDLGDVGAGGTSGPRGDMSAANLDARTRAAVDEANALADSLDLAPMPSMNSEDIFAEWLSDTLSIIRGADEKMRQAILAQMALKMIDQVISTFYKDKNDENADYHAQQLENISSQRTQQQNQIQLNQMVSGASNSQAVAAVGGAVSGAVRAEGFNLTALQGQSVEQMRQQVRQLVQDFGNNNPSSVTENQVSSILNQFDTILQAGSTPGIADDRAALVGMSELMAAQASRN